LTPNFEELLLEKLPDLKIVVEEDEKHS